MEAARLTAPANVAWQEAPEPTITGPEQVLIRTHYTTVCGSDLHNIFAGTSLEPYPARFGYPGHETTGEVIDSSADGVEVGQHVLGVPDLSCAAAFAEVQLLPERFVIPVEDAARGDDLVLAQQLGTVVWALKRFWPADLPGNGATAAVLGTGTAGLFFIQLLAARGFEHIVVSDLFPERLALAREAGATLTIQAPDGDLPEAVRSVTDGRGADLVVEAAGEDDTRTASIDAVALDGRVGLFGTASSLDAVPFPVDAFFRKKPLLMAQHSAQHEPGHASFREAIDLITRGEVVVDGIVTHWMAPKALPEALELALHPRGGSLKVGLDFTAGT